MMFPGGVDSSGLQQSAAEKVKKDTETFVIFGLSIEAVAVGASYLSVEGFLIRADIIVHLNGCLHYLSTTAQD